MRECCSLFRPAPLTKALLVTSEHWLLLKQLARSEVLARNPDTCNRTLKQSVSSCRLIRRTISSFVRQNGGDCISSLRQKRVIRPNWIFPNPERRASSERRPRRTCATKSIHREQNEVWQDPTRHGRCPIASMERIHGRLQAAQAGDQSRGGGPGCARDQNQLTLLEHPICRTPSAVGLD